MNIPMFLTYLRILAIPVFGVVYFLPVGWAHTAAAVIFVLAALTDWLDGYLARVLSQATNLGAFLDPVADKLLVAAALVVVVGQHYIHLLSVPAAIIVMREIAVSALREWMAEMGKRASVAVGYIGKVKTAVQMIALVLLVWYSPLQSNWLLWLGSALLCASAVLTLWSMIVYIKIAWPDLTLQQEKS